MARKRMRYKKKPLGPWLGLAGLAVALVLAAAKFLPMAKTRLSLNRAQPSVSLLRTSLDSLSSSGWQLWCRDSAGSDPVLWQIAIPHSLPLVKANLMIQRKAAAAGFSLSSAVENRKKGSLDLEFIPGQGPGLRISVIKRPTAAQAKNDFRLALAAYEIPGDFGRQLAALAKSKTVKTFIVGRRLEGRMNKEVVNFLPLEPKGYPKVDPGPNAILVDDRPSAIRAKLSRHLSMNDAPGLCIHKGSRAVEVRTVMDEVADFCGKKNLWLLEPIPTPASEASSSCKRFEVKYISPDVYISSQSSAAQTTQQLRLGLALARSRGRALVLLPASEPVLKAAESLLMRNENQDIKLTTISEILP